MLRLLLDTNDQAAVKSGANQTPADTTFIFGEILPSQVTNVGVCLDSATIPNIIPNIRAASGTSSGNNTLEFYENGGVVIRTATLTAGFYDANTLAAALQTAMNTAPGVANTYSVNYSTLTRKLSISTTLPNTYRILGSSTCLTQIGFDAEGTSSFTTTSTANYVINLLSTRYVDLVVNFNAASIALNKRSNILQRINLTEASGNIVFYQAAYLTNVVTSAESLRQIEVRLYDDQGALFAVDKTHQCTYSLILVPLD